MSASKPRVETIVQQFDQPALPQLVFDAAAGLRQATCKLGQRLGIGVMARA